MDQGKKISVIVPVYNTEAYLDRFLHSLDRQTCRNLSYIFVDDGSTDQSFSKIEAFCKRRNHNDRYVHQTNQGAAAARNTGLKMLEEDTFAYAFLDSDDYIEPDYFEKMLDGMVQYQADVVISGVLVKHNDVVSYQDSEACESLCVCDHVEYAKKVLLKKEASYIVANKLIRYRQEELLLFPDGLMFEDMYYASALSWRYKKFVLLPEMLYVYCINDRSVSHMKNSRQITDFDKIIGLVVSGYKKTAFYSDVKPELATYIKQAIRRVERKYRTEAYIGQEAYEAVIRSLSGMYAGLQK